MRAKTTRSLLLIALFLFTSKIWLWSWNQRISFMLANESAQKGKMQVKRSLSNRSRLKTGKFEKKNEQEKQQPDFLLKPNLSKYAFPTAGCATGWATYPFNFTTSKIAIQFFSFSSSVVVCRRIKLLCGEVSWSNSFRFSGKDRCRMSKCQRVSLGSLSRDFVWCLFSPSALRGWFTFRCNLVPSFPVLGLLKWFHWWQVLKFHLHCFRFLWNALRFVSLFLRILNGFLCCNQHKVRIVHLETGNRDRAQAIK